MQLTVLGSSGSYTLPGRPGSGLLIEAGGVRLWCDAGPGTFEVLCDLADPAQVDAVVVTHRHVDHSVDVLTAFHRFAYGSPQRRGIPLLAPADTLDRLAGFVGADTGHAWFDVFDPEPVGEGKTFELGGVEISFGDAFHSVPAVAVRVEHGGRSLVYTGDTGPEGDWMRLADGVDLLVAEATMLEATGETFPYHMTAADAGRIARSVGAAALMVTHLPPHIDPDVAVQEAESTFDRPVELAVPGSSRKV